MHWDNPDQMEEETVHHYLFHSSLKDLEIAEKQLSPQQKNLKGWLWLKIGDLFYAKQQNQTLYGEPAYRKACQAWNMAANYNKKLSLDVLKRLFLLSLEKDGELNPCELFAKFYQTLHEQQPKQAKSFVDHLHYLKEFHYQDLQPKTLRSENGTWLVNPPPVELQCLWLSVVYRRELYRLTLAFFIPAVSPEHYTGHPWQTWENLFQEVDPFYFSVDIYLQARCAVGVIHKQPGIVRGSLIQRLKNNPSLKNELLPIYVRNVSQTLETLLKDPAASLSSEIEALLYLFPCDYDLLYLKIRILPLEIQEQELRLATSKLSKPLARVLQFKLFISRGHGWAKNKQYIPSDFFAERDGEADWRFLAALSDPQAKAPVKKLSEVVDQLQLKPIVFHDYASKIYGHYGITLPVSLLKQWLVGGHRHYHVGLYQLSRNDMQKSLSAFEEAAGDFTPDDPERARVEATLSLYITEPSFEDLLQEFFGGYKI